MPYKDPEKQKEQRRRWYLAHRKETIAKAKLWKQENPGRYREWLKISRLKHNEHSRKWYETNKDHVLQYVKQWRIAHPEEVAQQRARYRKRNKDKLREKGKRYYFKNRGLIAIKRRALRREVQAAYGGKCACCGEKNSGFLTIDHINNDGASHRKQTGSGTRFYMWLKKKGFPQEAFRLLCWNCNVARAQHDGVCPHVAPVQ